MGVSMKVSFSNLGVYSVGNYKQVSFAKNVQQTKTMGVEDKLPNPKLYVDIDNFMFPYSQAEKLKTEYTEKIKSVCFDENGKVDEKIKNFLDTEKFEIKAHDGSKKLMTIREAIEESIVQTDNVNATLFHSTFVKENGQQIIDNGFDPNKISRVQLGPGFYFSGSEGGAREYNSCVLKADCKGKTAIFNEPYYERIVSSGIPSKLAEFIGFSSKDYGTGMIEFQMTDKILNEYTRNLIVDELGYDMAYGRAKQDTCYVVYNPDAISNIRFV